MPEAGANRTKPNWRGMVRTEGMEIWQVTLRLGCWSTRFGSDRKLRRWRSAQTPHAPSRATPRCGPGRRKARDRWLGGPVGVAGGRIGLSGSGSAALGRRPLLVPGSRNYWTCWCEPFDGALRQGRALAFGGRCLHCAHARLASVWDAQPVQTGMEVRVGSRFFALSQKKGRVEAQGTAGTYEVRRTGWYRTIGTGRGQAHAYWRKSNRVRSTFGAIQRAV